MKKCCRCKETKPTSEFGKNRSTGSGLQYWCNSCRTETRSIDKYNKIQKCLKYKNSKCEDCGKPFEYPRDRGKFEYHHIDPSTKLKPISRLIDNKRSWSVIETELNKCALLCRPCHLKRHSDFNKGIRNTL